MAIVTPPSSFTKGTAATYTLDVSSLAAHESVSGDAYFSDTDNWKMVKVTMVSSAGNQREQMFFDATQSSPTASFLVSTRARNDFEVESLTIYDFDGGSLSLARSDLNTSEFDISSVVPLFSIDFSNGFLAQIPTDLDKNYVYGSTAVVGGEVQYDASWLGLNYHIGNQNLGTTGAIHLKAKYNFSGTPSGTFIALEIGGESTRAHNEIQLSLNSNGNLQMWVYNSSGGSLLQDNTSYPLPSIVSGQYHNWAMEWKDGIVKVFFDSSEVASYNFTTGQRADGVGYSIGIAASSSGFTGNGGVTHADDVKVYDEPQLF